MRCSHRDHVCLEYGECYVAFVESFQFVVMRPIILSFNYSLLFVSFFEAKHHKLRMCVAWNFIWALEFAKRDINVLPNAKPHNATHAVCMYQLVLLFIFLFCFPHQVDEVKLHVVLKIAAIFPHPFVIVVFFLFPLSSAGVLVIYHHFIWNMAKVKLFDKKKHTHTQT